MTQHGLCDNGGRVHQQSVDIPAIPVGKPSTPPDLPTFPPSNPLGDADDTDQSQPLRCDGFESGQPGVGGQWRRQCGQP
ncbi:MAG: hypothetical protein U0350_16250 [Caldilineaceae bacterium]